MDNLTQNDKISLKILFSTNSTLRYEISANSQSFEEGFILNSFLQQLGEGNSYIHLGYYFFLPTGEEFWSELALHISSTYPAADVHNGESIFSFNASTIFHQTYSWTFDKATGLLRSFKQVVRDPTLNYGVRTPDELYLLRTDLKSKLPEIIHIGLGALILSAIFGLIILIQKKNR
ncbi:MAG: hypothetical protein EAX86_12670 [Candidatus Heimdallarchaeota archaeon]|nr:hypothetical protein [Candidatus Heimdallarchaeota archaeon]